MAGGVLERIEESVPSTGPEELRDFIVNFVIAIVIVIVIAEC